MKVNEDLSILFWLKRQKATKRVHPDMIKDAYMPKLVLQKTLMQAFKLHNEEFAQRVAKNKGSKGTFVRYERR